MDIEYFGANCIKLTAKQAQLVVDDNLSQIGGKQITKEDTVVVFTTDYGINPNGRMIIDSPGEYEISGFALTGIAARAHTDEEGKKSATMFKIVIDDIKVVVIGHIYPSLSEEQLEALGTVDILIIPVGGNGFTLDPTGALAIIKEIEPKIVIPTGYADKQLKYPVPAKSLQEALKEMGMEASETIDKLKIKTIEPSDTVKLIVLEKQS